MFEFKFTDAKQIFWAAIAVVGLSWMYNIQTCNLQLSRLTNEIHLVETAEKLDISDTNTCQLLESSKTNLISQIHETIFQKPLILLPSRLTISWKDTLLKMMVSASLPIILMLIILITQKDSNKSVSGLFIWACLSGLLGILIPPIWWPTFHIIILPLILLMPVLSLVMTLIFKSIKK